MTFGERLYELRNKENISQEKFAEIMNVSRQSISKWETDKAYPELSRLIFMSDYFHVSLDYLVRGQENEESTSTDSVASEEKKYQSEKMWVIWNTFTSNLNGTQKKMFIILYVLVTVALMGLILALSYGGGYVLGQMLYHLTH